MPKSLVSFEILGELIDLLIEKEKLRHTVSHVDFGAGVTDEKEADHLLKKVSQVIREILVP